MNDELQAHIREHGIDFVGVTTVAPFRVGPEGTVVDPHQTMPEARSLVVTGFYTYTGEVSRPSTPGVPRGRFGPWTRLSLPAMSYQAGVLSAFFRERGYAAQTGTDVPAKPAAVRAGWGVYGRNSLIHAPGVGSYVKIQTCLTDAPLKAVEQPIETSDCGQCRACVDACPTGALREPYCLDRARCICAWLWGRPAPRELRPTVGAHLLRCSYCLEACPLNHDLQPRESVPFDLDGPTSSPELIPLLSASEEELRQALPSFVLSAGAETLRRNVALALGNSGDPAAVPALAAALCDSVPAVRSYAAWALGRLGGPEARAALAAALAVEEEAPVQEELRWALGEG